MHFSTSTHPIKPFRSTPSVPPPGGSPLHFLPSDSWRPRRSPRTTIRREPVRKTSEMQSRYTRFLEQTLDMTRMVTITLVPSSMDRAASSYLVVCPECPRMGPGGGVWSFLELGR